MRRRILYRRDGIAGSAELERSRRVTLSMPWLSIVAGLVACGEVAPSADTATPTCAPACSGRECGDDGCGGVCGVCPGTTACSAERRCVEGAATDCSKSCADLRFACGEHCGASCGSCTGAQDACVSHQCVCQPACSAELCEADDGCGGECPGCARDVSCADCPLALSVVDREVVDGQVRTVTIALDFAPKAGSSLPGMADLRLTLEGPAELVEIAIGQSLITAEKGFYTDPETGRPYRELGDGTLQLLVMSTASTRDIPAGRWLFLKFRFGPSHGALTVMPLILSLVEREEIFAPAAADSALWGAHFGAPLVVWPDAVEVNHAP